MRSAVMATADGKEMAKEGGAGQETHEGESMAKRQEAEEAIAIVEVSQGEHRSM